MSVEWYYTTNKQQMGPVSWNELRELADTGILDPNDLVWADGMAEWVKASNQQGLFAEVVEEEEPAPSKKESSVISPPRRRAERKRDEEVEHEEEEEPRERKQRKPARSSSGAGMHVGVQIGLILGGVFAIFVLCGGCVTGIVWISLRTGDGGGRINQTFTVVNLQERRWEERRFHFPKDRRLLITVTGNAPPGCDIDLHIHRGGGPGENFIALDSSIGPHSRLEFTVPASDNYRVRVANLGPGIAHSCVVTISER